MYTLTDVQAMAKLNPISFMVPEDVQLDKFKGTIDNKPMCLPELSYKDEVEFERKNIYQVIIK